MWSQSSYTPWYGYAPKAVSPHLVINVPAQDVRNGKTKVTAMTFAQDSRVLSLRFFIINLCERQQSSAATCPRAPTCPMLAADALLGSGFISFLDEIVHPVLRSLKNQICSIG